MMKKNIIGFLIFFFGLIGFCRMVHATDALEALNKPTAQDFGVIQPDSDEDSNIVQKHLNRLERALASIGGFRIMPFFEQGFRLTNNVFHDPRGKKDQNTSQNTRKMDTIWTETPGVKALYVKNKTLIDLSYKADFDNFTKYSGQNSQNQTAEGIVKFAPSKNSYFNLRESYDKEQLISGSINFKPVSVWQNNVDVKTGYHLGKLTPEFNYRNFSRRFASDVEKPYDYSQNEYAMTFFYQLAKNWTSLIVDRLIQVDYTHNARARDALANDSRVGIRGLWSENFFEIRADAGTYTRWNRHSSDTKEPDYFVASLFLRKAVKNTLFELGYYRAPRESTFVNTTVYIEDAGYFAITQPLTKKLMSRANVILAKRYYDEGELVNGYYSKRHDYSIAFNAGLIYSFTRQLKLQLDYKIERQESNFSDYNYTENSLLSKLAFYL